MFSPLSCFFLQTKIYTSPCSTSVVFKTDVRTTPHAFFTDLKTPEGDSVSPEIYPRPDGTIYISGDHTDPLRQRPFTEKATDAAASEIAVKHHQERLALVSDKFKDAEILVTQACFRPESRRNKPLIGKLGEGYWMASGHSVWGICNGPGTGKVLVSGLVNSPSWRRPYRA